MSGMPFGLGATLYSFNIDFYTYRRTLEDCMEAVSSLGPDQGVELVSPMMDRGYPDLSPEFERRFKNGLEKFGLIPTCFSGYTDPQRFFGRWTSVDEQKEYLIRQMKAAKTLGFKIYRTQNCNSFFELAPVAEKLGIVLTFEVHAPSTIEELSDVFEKMDKLGSPYLGIVPDCGAFCRSPSDIYFKRFADQGVPEKVSERIRELWIEQKTTAEIREEIRKIEYNELIDLMVTESCEYFGHSDPKCMIPVMKYIPHFHGKFFHVDDAYSESAVRVPEIVAALKEGGFKGYISAEYEGHHWFSDTDALEQIRRYQELIRHCCE